VLLSLSLEMFLERLKKLSCKTTAAFLAIWLSGLVFLLCCQPTNAETGRRGFCPLAKMGGHCDRAKKDTNVLQVNDNSSEDGSYSCGMLAVIFDKTRKVEQNSQPPATISKNLVFSITPPSLAEHISIPSAFHPLIRARNKIFVRNCVFRI